MSRNATTARVHLLADAIIAVGYELQEFDPVRINPGSNRELTNALGDLDESVS